MPSHLDGFHYAYCFVYQDWRYMDFSKIVMKKNWKSIGAKAITFNLNKKTKLWKFRKTPIKTPRDTQFQWTFHHLVFQLSIFVLLLLFQKAMSFIFLVIFFPLRATKFYSLKKSGKMQHHRKTLVRIF